MHADINISNDQGITPLSYAQSINDVEIINRLQSVPEEEVEVAH